MGEWAPCFGKNFNLFSNTKKVAFSPITGPARWDNSCAVGKQGGYWGVFSKTSEQILKDFKKKKFVTPKKTYDSEPEGLTPSAFAQRALHLKKGSFVWGR